MSKIWRFQALDTWFFRDGTPFHQGEAGNIVPVSTFPPPIMTLQGAIRTALARKQGWTPDRKESWPDELGTPDDLGDLRLAGPYLRFEGERLYPAPLVLFGKKSGEKWELERMVPGPEVDCDLGRGYRLPRLKRRIEGDLLNLWVTREGLETIFGYDRPNSNQMFEPRQLWGHERRIGIMRERETGTVKEGHLYSLQHVRPHPKLEVEVEVGGIPDDWHLADIHALPLGGEGRFTRVQVVGAKKEPFPRLPELPVSSDGKVRFTVSLLTHGCFEDMEEAVKSGPSGVPGKCVSAVIGKVIQIGGWDLKNARPRPLVPLLPPGSTWFFEADTDQREKIRQLHGSFSGEKTEYGMGQLVVGIWKEEGEE